MAKRRGRRQLLRLIARTLSRSLVLCRARPGAAGERTPLAANRVCCKASPRAESFGRHLRRGIAVEDQVSDLPLSTRALQNHTVLARVIHRPACREGQRLSISSDVVCRVVHCGRFQVSESEYRNLGGTFEPFAIVMFNGGASLQQRALVGHQDCVFAVNSSDSGGVSCQYCLEIIVCPFYNGRVYLR
jgi:hypothetical protein